MRKFIEEPKTKTMQIETIKLPANFALIFKADIHHIFA